MGNCLIKKFVAKEDVFDTGTRLGRVRVPSQQIAQDLNNQLSCWQKCKLFCCFCQNRNLFKWIVAYPRSTTDKFVKKNCQSIIMKYKLIDLKLILSTTFVWSHFSSWFMVTIFFNFSLTCNIFIWIHFWLIRKFKTRNPSKLSLITFVYISDHFWLIFKLEKNRQNV